MRHFFGKRGWECFSSCPLDSRVGGGLWIISYGGVGVLVLEGLTGELLKLLHKRESDPLVLGLWYSTWWLHVRVALGDTATMIHAVSAYGVAGDRESN